MSHSKKIALIAAMSSNGAIGHLGKMPWHLSADLQHFKAVTMGKPILMGRRTFQTIGRVLPGRENIVISSKSDFRPENVTVVNSIEDGLQQAFLQHSEVMVIGGGEVYRQTIDLADTLYLTVIQHEFVADTFFPHYQPQQWLEKERQDFQADAKNPYAYSFITLERCRTSA